MGCDLLSSSVSYELAFVCFGFLAFCYGKTLKHMMASRCTSIRFGCISCDRQPLSDAAAVDVIKSPEVLELGSPTSHLRSITF